MIIHKNLLKFLEIIYNNDLNFNNITETKLKESFKNNEYYILKDFCIKNELININYRKINLTYYGIDFFKILKKCKNI